MRMIVLTETFHDEISKKKKRKKTKRREKEIPISLVRTLTQFLLLLNVHLRRVIRRFCTNAVFLNRKTEETR